MRRPFAGLMLTVALAGALGAQSSRITGSVVTTADEPLAGAHVLVQGLGIGAVTQPSGSFTISNVPVGHYDLKVYRLGYRPATLTDIVVRAGEDSRIATRLEPTPVALDAIVASVSRRAETIVDAPAAVTQFDTSTIAASLGSPVTHLLARAPGIDLTQVGVLSSFVNGRGFNRVFNSRWLTVEDGRVATFAETGLPIGEHTTIPAIDLADLEVVAGPGSALYGANASGGFLSVNTKDPRQYPGLAIELGAGTRQFRDLQMRYAGSNGRWAYKVAGQEQSATDWADTVVYTAVTPGGPALPEVPRDLRTSAQRVEGSLIYDVGSDAHLALNLGANTVDGLGQTTTGRYRISNYMYRDEQLVFRSPRWLAQAYSTESNTGDTYRLNFLTQALAASPTISHDSALAIAAFPADGRIETLELQNNEVVGAHARTGVGAIDDSHLTWGVQQRRDRVDSHRRLYTDAVSGKAIQFDLRAFYAQIESPLTSSLRLVGAERYDTHSRFGSSWSPKIGVLYDLAPDRVLRLTYNGAYLAPSILQTDVYAVNAAAHFASIGNGDGFDIRDASGALINTYSRVRPETNQTWEAGFKGVLGRFYMDATLYRSTFRDFMTLVGPIDNPLAASPTFAFDHQTGQRINDPAGNALLVFTFTNLARGSFDGMDAGLRYYLTDRVSLSSSTSLTHVIALDTRPTDPPGAAAFNTSPNRSSLGVDYADGPNKRLELGLRARYVEGYEFQSGVDWGHLPTFGMLGASASYRLRPIDATLILQADNLASCVAGTTSPPATGVSPTSQATYTARQSCGIAIRHHEILNMPAVGAMIFVGVRREWQ